MTKQGTFVTKISTAALAVIAIMAFAASPASAGEQPNPGHVAWTLEKHGFGRLATIDGKLVEYPREDPKVSPADAKTSAVCTDFLGAWFGTLSNGRPLLLIVSSVSGTDDCDTTTYMSWGSEPGKSTNIKGPWSRASNGIYKRAGRNMPVGKHLDGEIDGGTMTVQPTRKSSATMKVSDGQVMVSWGSTRATLAPLDLRSIELIEPVQPSAGFAALKN